MARLWEIGSWSGMTLWRSFSLPPSMLADMSNICRWVHRLETTPKLFTLTFVLVAFSAKDMTSKFCNLVHHPPSCKYAIRLYSACATSAQPPVQAGQKQEVQGKRSQGCASCMAAQDPSRSLVLWPQDSADMLAGGACAAGIISSSQSIRPPQARRALA